MAILALISATGLVGIMKNVRARGLNFLGTYSNKNMPPIIFRVESIVDFKSLHTWKKVVSLWERNEILEG